MCNLVTPNIPEAEVLIGSSISNKKDMIEAAKLILNMGSKNVLLKGGHLKSKMIFDILATKKGIKINDSSLEDITKKYGDSYNVYSFFDSNFLVYKKHNIIFEIKKFLSFLAIE